MILTLRFLRLTESMQQQVGMNNPEKVAKSSQNYAQYLLTHSHTQRAVEIRYPDEMSV